MSHAAASPNKRMRATAAEQHDNAHNAHKALPEAPRNDKCGDTDHIIKLRQGFSGDVLCQARRRDLLTTVAALLQKPTVLIRLASKLVLESGIQSWSWEEVGDNAVEIPQEALMLIRHDGQWQFLDHLWKRLQTATCVQELLLPLFSPRWGVSEPLAAQTEGREVFQERLLYVMPTLAQSARASRICNEEMTKLTEWVPADHDMASLLLAMETRGKDLFRICQGNHATFELQQIVGSPARSYFVWLIQRAMDQAPPGVVPKALTALHLACTKEPEYGFNSFTWLQNPALQQGLAMQDEWGALALRLYFDLHDVCPRVVHVSFPEAASLLDLVDLVQGPDWHYRKYYRKYLLKPVLKRLTFSGCVKEAGLLTHMFVETLDGDFTEKDVCRWIEHFWHLDVQQFLEAVGRPMLSVPSKAVQSSWSTNPKVLTTHRLLQREYELHAHNDVLPWPDFVARATVADAPPENTVQKAVPTRGQGKKRKPCAQEEGLGSH
jgi:hypothetical protein